MKDLYIKPEIELKEFDLLDVITTSPGDESGANTNGDPDDWSGWIEKAGKLLD
ncbi:MAG: hypothetical protein K6E58_00650 [Eubacterium sp.]|nr:hypothetical protein [Eubacterium sp.]